MSEILKDNKFIHLRNHSSYSLCEGSIRIEELIEYAQKSQIPAIAICDKHNMFGALEFSTKCKKSNIQPIISCQIRLNINEILGNTQNLSALDINNSLRQSILIAKNQQGYLNLLKLVSDSYINRETGIDPYIKLSDLAQNSEGLIFLCGNLHGVFGKLILEKQSDKLQILAEKLLQIFKNDFYIELHRHGENNEDKIEEELIKLAFKNNIALVASNDNYFLNQDMHEAQDILSCIGTGRYFSEKTAEKSIINITLRVHKK